MSDKIHNYHFGQWPEMPWKENKMKRLRASDLTAKEVAAVLYGLEELDDSNKEDNEFTDEFTQFISDLRKEFNREYEKRHLDWTMFAEKEE